MRAGAKSATVWTLPLAVVLVAMAAMAADPGGVATRIRDIQFDAYQYLHPRGYEDPAVKSGYTVRILDADDASLARFGAWPWPRSVLAKLAAELKAAGAAAVVFDTPLATPDPSSPQSFAESLPPGPDSDAARRALANLPSPDTAFANALSTIASVTPFTLMPGMGGRLPGLKTAIVFDGSDRAFAHVPAFGRAAAALPAFEAASAGIGARNLPADADGTLRALPIFFRLDGKLVPSLDAEAIRLLGGAPLQAVTAEHGLPGIGSAEILVQARAGNFSLPVRADGAMNVYFSGPRAQRHISAAALDTGTVPAGWLAHAVVYLAAPDETVMTPVGPRSVAEFRAEAMENVLLHLGLKPDGGLYGGLAFVLFAGIGIALLLARKGVLWAGALTVAAIAAAQTATWLLFTDTQTLFDSLGPSLALAASFGVGFAARGVEIARTRNLLRRAFSDALPVMVLDRIARKPQLLKLEGETRTVTCLACGVRGFAALAESFADDPAGFTRTVGSLVSALADTAIAHGAMVDCLTGEGFLAYWNAPLDDPEHAIHACEAAARMLVVLAQTNEQLSRERRFDGTAFEPVEIGIGISTGPAIAGGFGARGRTAYSVTGECTLLAERIRTQSAQYGPAVVVGDDTRKAAERGYAFLEVDFVACGPRNEPVKLFALLGNPLVRASPKFRALATFHEHIFQSLRTQQWEKTRELIAQCRQLSGASQKLYDLHLERIRYFEQHPPGADWDGAFRVVLK